MTKSKRHNSLSKYVKNYEDRIGRHWSQRKTVSDLVYKYLSIIADNYTHDQQSKSAYRQFRKKNQRRKKIN